MKTMELKKSLEKNKLFILENKFKEYRLGFIKNWNIRLYIENKRMRIKVFLPIDILKYSRRASIRYS